MNLPKNFLTKTWMARENLGHKISEKSHKYLTQAYHFGLKGQEADQRLRFE